MKHLFELERARGYSSDFQTFQGRYYSIQVTYSRCHFAARICEISGIARWPRINVVYVYGICRVPFAHAELARSLNDLRGRYQHEDQRRHSFGDVRSLVSTP